MYTAAKTWRNVIGRVSPLDAMLVAGFCAVGMLELRLPAAEAYRGTAPVAVDASVVALTALALLWRRRAPLRALIAVAAALVLPRLLLDSSVLFYAGLFPFLVALYSASCYARPPLDRWALLVPATLIAAFSLAIPSFRSPNEYAFSTAVFLAVWLVGQGTRRWRATSEQLRLALLESSQVYELRQQAAIAEERSRIARELHDVIAHSVSLMVLQASAARLDLLSEQDGARRALQTVESTGRTAMVELRRMVGILRTADDGAPLEAAPTLDQLESLVDEMRAAGLDVRLSVLGARRPLPDGLELSAYRIVQEALTNALQHAGTAPVEVVLRYAPDILGIDVRNGASSPQARTMRGRGHGLVGMRERAALFGGCVDAGPSPDGGYRVRAELPLGTPWNDEDRHRR